MEKITKVVFTPNELLETYASSAYDRPSAYSALCGQAGITDEPDLAMHAKSDELGWEGDDQECLDHIEKHFGIDNVPRLFSQEWDT